MPWFHQKPNDDTEKSSIAFLVSQGNSKSAFEPRNETMIHPEEGVFIVDGELTILEANPAVARLLGRAAPLTGEKCHGLFHEAGQPCPSCAAVESLATGTPARHRFRLEASPARPGRWLELVTMPLPEPGSGEIRKVLGRLKDVSSMGEEEAAQAAARIAQVCENLFAVILGYTHLARQDLAADHPQQRYLSQILKAVEKGRHLMTQIGVLSPGFSPARRPVRLGRLIRDILSPVQASLSPRLHIKINLTATQDLVLADPGSLELVLLNLWDNARQAMGQEGGLWEITLQEAHLGPEAACSLGVTPGSCLQLSLRDTGPGIAPEHLDRIFLPFFTTRSPAQGLGLGLTVVQRLIQAHAGAITVESGTGGATFNLFLPRLCHTLPGERPREISGDSHKTHILLAAEARTWPDPGQEALEALGYRVTAATHPSEVLKVFQSQPRAFALVIADYTLPEITGVELARRLLKLRPDLPIILCAGLGEAPGLEGVREGGIREIILKPLSMWELAHTISKVLEETDRGGGYPVKQVEGGARGQGNDHR
mgnify:CR=1 FL=1